MYSKSLFALFAAVLALNGFPSTATATLPGDLRVSFTIRETPTDPESDVRYHVILDLEAADSDHAFVAWDITQI
ncbi:hypothetical protein KJ815_14195, partial [bacterium]|nr:hypothetical protein [bacterium]